MVTTDEFFEQRTLGPRVAVVGLGAIGAELGQALGQLGLEVHGYPGHHSSRASPTPQ